MKAVVALIVIYVGTFLIAIQGASNSPVEASEQSTTQSAAQTGAQTTLTKSIDPVKETEIRSLLELIGSKDAIQDSAAVATEQYRQKVMEASFNNDRAQAFTNTYLAEFQKKFDADAVNSQLVEIYDKHFTEDDIKGLLEFYGSPLGQKVAAELPKIGREVQLATRTASNQAARQAWQDLRRAGALNGAPQENSPNAGDSTRPFANRRRGLTNAQARPQQQPANQQATADSSQP